MKHKKDLGLAVTGVIMARRKGGLKAKGSERPRMMKV